MVTKKANRPSTKNATPEPPADRPSFAKGYGIKKDADGMVPWRDACARLEKSRNYWVATMRPDGRPHVMPVWGVWHGGAVIFGTDRNSRKGRNLQANPQATVHLESGDDVVILECTPREVTDKNEIAAIDVAYKKKYKMKLTQAPGELYIVAMQPRVAFAWHEKDFPVSATRWKF
jgi:hypothetical protein